MWEGGWEPEVSWYRRNRARNRRPACAVPGNTARAPGRPQRQALTPKGGGVGVFYEGHGAPARAQQHDSRLLFGGGWRRRRRGAVRARGRGGRVDQGGGAGLQGPRGRRRRRGGGWGSGSCARRARKASGFSATSVTAGVRARRKSPRLGCRGAPSALSTPPHTCTQKIGASGSEQEGARGTRRAGARLVALSSAQRRGRPTCSDVGARERAAMTAEVAGGLVIGYREAGLQGMDAPRPLVAG